MLSPNKQHNHGLVTKMNLKPQRVYNPAINKRTEIALVQIFILELFNIILIWEYFVSTTIAM